jgi:hypothetical protein
VAADREEFFYLGAFAGWAGYLLVAEHQHLKVLIAFHAVIFINGHA